MARFRLSRTTFYDARSGRPIGNATADALDAALATRVVLRPFLNPQQIREVRRAIDQVGRDAFDLASGASESARRRALHGHAVTSTTVDRLTRAARDILRGEATAADGQIPRAGAAAPPPAGGEQDPPDNGSLNVKVTLSLSRDTLAGLAAMSVRTGRGITDLVKGVCEKAVKTAAT